MSSPQPSVQHPQSMCRFGSARCEITPPVGIYHRMWGAATHERATGIHRPLLATALVFQALDYAAHPEREQILIALDHVLFWANEMEQLLASVSKSAGIEREKLAVSFSHTHAAGLMDLERQDLPGGELIPEYLDSLSGSLVHLIKSARWRMEPVNITYGIGRCSLAAHRDFWDEDNQQFVCGFHPDTPADDTVLIARVNHPDGEPLAVVVNYACHPTTLAWQNTLISPDFIGAMREVVEKETQVPCVFLQGASGDLGPREGYVGDTEIADKNGRQLGFAVLSQLAALPPPMTKFTYRGPVVSGATLGIWDHEPLTKDATYRHGVWRLQRFTIDLPYRSDLPTASGTLPELNDWKFKEEKARASGDEFEAGKYRAMVERMQRRLTKIKSLPEGPTFPFPVVLWRMGDALWVALEAELYHWFQTELRRRFADKPIMVVTLTNGSRPSYLPTADAYGKGIYQETIAVLEKGSLETLLEAVCDKITGELLSNG